MEILLNINIYNLKMKINRIDILFLKIDYHTLNIKYIEYMRVCLTHGLNMKNIRWFPSSLKNIEV
jgi:hypothetical protein